MMKFDVKNLKQWFARAQRELPWRVERSPYSVWVSEMMLQQTQVAVVIPYFQRWMERFPTIASLAEAHLDEVIKMWEGLGYYSRARYLHQGAVTIMKDYDGVFPHDPKELSKLKGIGVYTVGAICSLAFHQKIPAVDGNVLRVLSRYFLIEEDIAKPVTQTVIRNLALSLLPDEEPWIVNEALIELGATICSRKPSCKECPLKKSCLGYLHNKAHLLPNKSNKVKMESLYRVVLVIRCGDYFLLRRGQAGEIMSDLHEFPFVESSLEGVETRELEKRIGEDFLCKAAWKSDLPHVTHSFTRYRVLLMPKMFNTKQMGKVEHPYQWVSLKQMEGLAFSSGHRRLLQSLLNVT